jgi:hypothetical protein
VADIEHVGQHLRHLLLPALAPLQLVVPHGDDRRLRRHGTVTFGARFSGAGWT